MGNTIQNCMRAEGLPTKVLDEDLREYAEERAAAIRAVLKASLLCRKVQESLVSEETIEKKDRSPVTVADFAAQAVIISELTKAFPRYPFIAEENSKALAEQEDLRRKVWSHVHQVLPYLEEEKLLETIDKGKNKKIDSDTKLWWTIDPVDGTLGFLRKGQYAVCLALMEDNEPVLGVLGCPNLSFRRPAAANKKENTTEQEEGKGKEVEGSSSSEQQQESNKEEEGEEKTGCLLVAVRGQGAFIRDFDSDEEYAIHTSDITSTAEANFTESFESSHSSHGASAEIAKRLQVSKEPIRIDSQCKYALIARGEASIYLRLSSSNYQEKIWDHAAGVVIVKEAGGEVCDLKGEKLDFGMGRTLSRNQGVVATNGKIHEEVMRVVKEVLAEEQEAAKKKDEKAE
ncbi:3'(2'),5'-bisphosphate nucleotidase [Balamuthia mandrillaris]